MPAQLGVQYGKCGRGRFGGRKCRGQTACARLGGQPAKAGSASPGQRIQLAQAVLQRGAVRVRSQFCLKLDQCERLTGTVHCSAFLPFARRQSRLPPAKKWGKGDIRCK